VAEHQDLVTQYNTSLKSDATKTTVLSLKSDATKTTVQQGASGKGQPPQAQLRD
jgi:hypothetical protein